MFRESAHLLDYLLSPELDISQALVDNYWDMLFNDIRKWDAKVTDHDKQIVAGTIFMVVRATLTQHWDSRYSETVCELLNYTLERKLQDCEKQEQTEFLQRLMDQSPILCEWINSYDDAGEWLSDKIADDLGSSGGEDVEDGSRHGDGKPGAKQTKFESFIVQKKEAQNIIAIIEENIDIDNPKQAALLIVGAIEAGKVSIKVTAPSISRKFGVNEASIKPHLKEYRSCKDGKQPYFKESELKPYIDLFSNQK